MSVILQALCSAAAAAAFVSLLGVWRGRQAWILARHWREVIPSTSVSRFRVAAAAAFLAAVASSSWGGVDRPPAPEAFAVVFVYDVSRSMAATDVPPSRRVVGSQIIRGLMAPRAGAFGLVVFAGEAVAVAPLTSDAEAVAAALAEVVDTNFRRGAGSAPASALTLALDMLASSSTPRAVVLVSDGEWTDPSGLPDVLERARRMNVPVSTIGVGSAAGARLGDRLDPATGHTSRLDRDALKAIASRTAGQDVTAEDLGHIETFLSERGQSTTDAAPDWLRSAGLLAAFGLLLSEGRFLRRRGERKGATADPGIVRALVTGLAALTLGSCTNDRVSDGNRHFDAGDYAGAASAFSDAAAAGASDAGIAWFNLAIALGRSGQMDHAIAALDESASRLSEDRPRALSAFNRGVALAELGRLGEAATAFVDALTIDASLEDARINLVIVRERLRAHRRSESVSVRPVPMIRYVLPRPSPRASRSDADW